MFEGEKYVNAKTIEDMQKFVLDRLDLEIKTLGFSEWHHEERKKHQWMLFLCGETQVNCPEEDTMLKLTAMLVKPI